MINEQDELDAAARAAALDVTRSFLVHAPAGSGKTELLIQRYLALLACVDRPERIVAMTFTRKAAAEMRDRIVDALRSAEDGAAQDAHKRKTRALARAALKRDRALGWELIDHPAQLRIYTIDAFCAAIDRQAPITTRFGASPRIEDPSAPLYRGAVQAGLIEADAADASWQAVLAHLDNDASRAVPLFADMLAKRDQWLKHLVARDAAALRAAAEAALVDDVEGELGRLRDLFPAQLAAELAPLLQYAAANLVDGDDRIEHSARMARCGARGALPDANVASIDDWKTLADFILTASGPARRTFSKRDGFPGGKMGGDARVRKSFRNRAEKLARECTAVPGLCEALDLVRRLPAHAYDDASWNVVSAMLDLLPRLAAQLKLTFAESGAIDYAEAMLAAISALGDADAPSDLLLRLDLTIDHLLVDEFQDTSDAQYALIERLTAGWQEGDGRTMFAVGDPMQSIYRFREAEVRLFLDARRQRSIGTVPVTSIELTRNFRSQARIVEWVNEVFPQVFPSRDDPWRSAVAYTKASAACAPLPAAPSIELFPDAEAEAHGVVERVRSAIAGGAQNIAILVRARAHLDRLLPALHRAGIPFGAVDLESLADRQAILDLLSLTHALVQPADRLAWLALLRAPWCGVGLNDLFTLAQAADQSDWCEAIVSDAVRAQLSRDGARRLARCAAVIRPALETRGRASLVSRVRGAWLALGGPACVDEPLDLDAADRFFALLGAHERAGDIADYDAFIGALHTLKAAPDDASQTPLRVMTLHKAKGLEFDTVILPALDRTTAREEARLLRWRVRPGGLLLAPAKPRGSEDSIYDYLGALAADEADAELARVLYVGCTRATTRLHLTAVSLARLAKNGEAEWKKPPHGSALHKLWPALHRHLPAPAISRPSAHVINAAPPLLARLPLDYRLPDPPPTIPFDAGAAAHERIPREFDWAQATAAAIGSVAHRLMAEMGRNGIAKWQNSSRARIERELANEGVEREAIAHSVDVVSEVVRRVLSDARGRWLFDPAHEDAQSELALAGDDAGALVHVTLDRTFVANGVRWIVDFKTGRHEGADLSRFLDTEVERYGAQLARYARVMRGIDPHSPLRLALYYPLVDGGWREWTAAC